MNLLPLVVTITMQAVAGPAQDSAAPAPLTRYEVAAGQDITVADRLFDELLSPFCPGLTLKNCPSPAADSLRRSIRSHLDQGESIEAVKAALVEAYGETILGAPPATGFNLVLWVLPWLSVAAGGTVLALLIVRRRRRREPPSDTRRIDPTVSSEEERRLAAVMRDLA